MLFVLLVLIATVPGAVFPVTGRIAAGFCGGSGVVQLSEIA
jgi:hypothetical protein